MDLKLDGKVALVTGSSSGIGFGIAASLRSEGAKVVLNGRDRARLERAAEQLPGSDHVMADVSAEDGAESLIQRVLGLHRRLDVLVCNVGSGASVSHGQETQREWTRMFELNFLSAALTVTAATEALAASSGAVVCISSICGIEAIGCPHPYGAAKAALEAYVRNAARHLGPRGVRINSLAPGNILFPGSVWDRKLNEDPDGVREMLEREVPLRRLGDVDDIGRAAAFLASPVASFITGTTFVVDGGQTR